MLPHPPPKNQGCQPLHLWGFLLLGLSDLRTIVFPHYYSPGTLGPVICLAGHLWHDDNLSKPWLLSYKLWKPSRVRELPGAEFIRWFELPYHKSVSSQLQSEDCHLCSYFHARELSLFSAKCIQHLFSMSCDSVLWSCSLWFLPSWLSKIVTVWLYWLLYPNSIMVTAMISWASKQGDTTLCASHVWPYNPLHCPRG